MCCTVVPPEKITCKASDVAKKPAIVLFSSSTRDRHAQCIYIGGRSENNIKCVGHDDLGRKNRTTHNCRFSAISLALQVTFSVS